MSQTLKGFRDFLPAEKRKRDFVLQKIKSTFERYGFAPVETPTLEYASLLLGKYGAEADKLVYTFTDRGEREIGLRYDQTVPTARLLTQYQHVLPRFFRRYQMQNVFRADKPQKGRYREFLQCDCDIFGSQDALADAEIISVFYQLYADIGLSDIRILVNDRVTLISTLQPFATETVSVFSIIQSVDKLDKQPVEEVCDELAQKGLDRQKASEALMLIQNATPSEELKKIMQCAIQNGVPETALVFKPTLARGLDYYTGVIFESVIPGVSGGSLGGGGRYDNLIESLGGTSVPAVGFAVGFDRTLAIADEKGLIPSLNSTSQILVTVFDDTCAEHSLRAAQTLRTQGFNVEIYPKADSIGKQLKYADMMGVPYALIIGPDEIQEGMVSLKNLKTGDSQKLPLERCGDIIKP